MSQDYPGFEVIVSDNASTDDTSQVMKKYLSDSRVRYYRNDVNIGVLLNWRKLLYEYAAGQYGKLLCDDEYLYDKEHLKKGIELILKGNLDIVISGSIQRKEEPDGKITDIVYDPQIPIVTDTVRWLKNGGRKFNGNPLFLNFASGAIFSIEKAKGLKAFIPDTFGPD